MLGCLADLPVERGGPAAVEGMSEGHLGLAQHDAQPGKVERAEERRRHQRRMHRRAHVVTEALERQGLGAGPAPDGRRPLEDLDPEASPGQCECSGQAVRSRTNHHGIHTLHKWTIAIGVTDPVGFPLAPCPPSQ